MTIDNIILNLSGGLLPKHLTEQEVDLLVFYYGKNWFEHLGYSEPKYEKPKIK